MKREADNPPDPAAEDEPLADVPVADAPTRSTVSLPGRGLIALVRLYQTTLSPLIGRQCRFQPTCSNYFIEAVEKRGALVGTFKGLWRICRCSPFCKGGYDPVE